MKKMLIVLDLNGTLIHRNKKNIQSFTHRPHAHVFLNYLLDNFKVMIWSSARPENVNRMTRSLFEHRSDQLLSVWTRKDFGLTDEQYNSKTKTYKPLDRVWSAYPTFNSTNTLIIDDDAYKIAGYEENAVILPSFDGRDSDDTQLLDLMQVMHKASAQGLEGYVERVLRLWQQKLL